MQADYHSWVILIWICFQSQFDLHSASDRRGEPLAFAVFNRAPRSSCLSTPTWAVP